MIHALFARDKQGQTLTTDREIDRDDSREGVKGEQREEEEHTVVETGAAGRVSTRWRNSVSLCPQRHKGGWRLTP